MQVVSQVPAVTVLQHSSRTARSAARTAPPAPRRSPYRPTPSPLLPASFLGQVPLTVHTEEVSEASDHLSGTCQGRRRLLR